MISIITVVKNGAATIERTILSVIEQDYSDYEYIVIDGKSTDGTMQILEKYSDKICKIVSEKDKGIYDAMNKGISLAKGDWIYFLGCDDIFFKASTLSEVISNDLAEVDVVYGNVEFLHSHEIYDGEYDSEKFCIRTPCHQAIFYRKELFAKFGNFELKYRTASDYVINVKTFSGGARWKYIDQIIAVFAETGISFAGKKDKDFYDDLFKILFDNLGSKISDLALSRVFYSTYPRFFMSHKLSESLQYLSGVVRRIGLFKLTGNFFVILIKYKIRNEVV